MFWILAYFLSTGSLVTMRLPPAAKNPVFNETASEETRKKPIQLYVSPKGDDRNPGTKSSPFKSLEGARNVVRLFKKSNPDRPVLVRIRGGIYPLEKAVMFENQDSGSEKGRIVYQAMPGEKPVFTGSKVLEKWAILKDQQALSKLDPSVRGKVYVTSLTKAGISNFGDPTQLGARPDLYCNQQLQTLARWPNSGFVKAGRALGKTELPPTYIAQKGTREGMIEYLDKRQNRWVQEKDARLGGYWYWDWSDEFHPIERIDTLTGTIQVREPYHRYGYKDSLRYFGLNLFCELDKPGEWYLDRGAGLLYWYPPEGVDPAIADVRFTSFSAPYMAELKKCFYITFQGLAFMESRGSAIRIEDGQNCLLSNCRVERFGRDGIHIMEGYSHGIAGCTLTTFGCGGIKVKGGDRKTLRPAGHFIEHTVVENFSLFKRTYEPAIHLDGCGLRISNNRLRYSSSSAFRLEGNNFLIEYNQISQVVDESDDQGGLDIFNNPSYRGIVIRYNHWKEISGGTRHGAAGVRLDDMISGVHIYGNVFEKCGGLDFGAIQINGGKDNRIENNLFFKCPAAVSFNTWGAKWLKELDSPSIQKKIYQDVDIQSSLYQQNYPELKNIRLSPTTNTVINNVLVDCDKILLRDQGLQRQGNNIFLSASGRSIETFCSPNILHNFGLISIPFQTIGPQR